MAKSKGGNPSKPRNRTTQADVAAGVRTAQARQAVIRATRREKLTRSSISSLPGPAQGAADERNRRVDATTRKLNELPLTEQDVVRAVNRNPNASLEDMARTIKNDVDNKQSLKNAKSSNSKLGTTPAKKRDRSAASKKAWETRRKRGG